MSDDATIAHIGVAVPDISEALVFYQEILGLTPEHLDDADGAAIASIPFGDIHLELLEPRDADTPIGRFIAKRGPGIHHVCIRVPDLDAALARCREHGYQLVDDQARAGAHGKRIAFLHPRSTSGILLELTE